MKARLSRQRPPRAQTQGRGAVWAAVGAVGTAPSVLTRLIASWVGAPKKHGLRSGLSLALLGNQGWEEGQESQNGPCARCHLTCWGMWLVTHLHRQLVEWTKETQPVEGPGKLRWGPSRKCQSRGLTGAKLTFQRGSCAP